MTDPVRYKLKIKIVGPTEMLDEAQDVLFGYTPKFHRFKRNEERIKVKIFLTEEQREYLAERLEAIDAAQDEDTFHYIDEDWD